MRFAIPILVQEHAGEDGQKSYRVQPLFHPAPVCRAAKLKRALNDLTSQLHPLLRDLARKSRHDALAEWTHLPALEDATLTLRLELGSGAEKCEVFLVGYAALDRQCWFTPRLPQAVFEVLPGQDLAERATAVLTQHLRQLEKRGELDLGEWRSPGKARLTTLEVELEIIARGPARRRPERALLFGSLEKKDGEVELRKTGRPLHQLYPDDLARAVGRDAEVAALARLLAGTERRPVVLVGPRQAGKTAILHELAWRIGAGKAERYAGGRQIWLLSPARLISGMSYLGEWENRVLAILTYARAQDRVLYFDDLPGLFTAGLSAASNLSVAQVIKPHLEQRFVRVVAEVTPEAWRRLRERDRAFADLFQVIPVAAMGETETMRVLTAVARQAEEDSQCRFGLSATTTIFHLLQRFGGDAVFPGKAAGFLRELAARHPRKTIGEAEVNEAFQARTGLAADFLDAGTTLDRPTITAKLRRDLVGQDPAVEAFADTLAKFKARLNDPRRPLGTFLLLGPTGVGKTQAAKALARTLFGEADRLLRFDLNEYVEPATAARLTGTPQEPEGLLTGAIRRQPFSVVLFDEIEKAAPEVFDLLLAVLDEGRLTDSLGRVADFTQSILVLTSNLGAREARSRLGFGADAVDEDELFVGAAEKFFRPEFFNRLDRVIPFRSLTREQLDGIAGRLVAEVCQREGLRRRDCVVEVRPAAREELVRRGHHPQLGARALKRVVERELAQPLARHLAGLPPSSASLAVLSAAGGEFALRVTEIPQAARLTSWHDLVAPLPLPEAEATRREALLGQAEACLRRTEQALDALAPAGPLRVGALSPAQTRYALGREQWRRVAAWLAAASEEGESPVGGHPLHSVRRFVASKLFGHKMPRHSPKRGQLRSVGNLAGALASLASGGGRTDDTALADLLREAAWLEVMLAGAQQETPFALRLRVVGDVGPAVLERLTRLYRVALASAQGNLETTATEVPPEVLPPVATDAKAPGRAAIWCEGWGLRRLFPARETCLRVRGRNGALGFVEVACVEVSGPDGLRACLAQAGETDVLAPATHDLTSRGDTLDVVTDLRTGLVLRGEAEVFARARDFLLAVLPLPPEFAGDL